MKISKKDLKEIIKEEIEATLTEEFGDDAPFRARDMVPPKVRGKLKDTFTKIPNPDLEKRSAERKPDAQEKAAWKAAGGALSVFDKPTIAQFLEDAGLNISLEKYMDNIKLAVENDRLGRQIVSLVDALALANKTGSRRGHLKTAKKKSSKPPQFTREAVTSMEEIIAEEIEVLMAEDDDWIQKAVDPEHEGDCTPMTKKTCTPARKALAKRFKKAAKKKEKQGGTGWQGKV